MERSDEWVLHIQEGYMKRFIPVALAFALILTACQSASETIAEQLTEQVDGVDNVEFDSDTGEVKIETDEGSITVGGGELPDGFPIPLPDGYQVTSVFTAEGTSAVSLAYPEGDFDTIVAFFEDWTSSQPTEWSTSTSSISGDDGTIDSASWIEDEGSSFISVSTFCVVPDDSIDPENCVSVSINTSE
jgi:hypothetical protein